MADRHNGSSRQRGVRVLVIALAAALVAVSAWSLAGYAQGADPLAWLTSQPALQTTQESRDAASGEAHDAANASANGGAAQGTNASSRADASSQADAASDASGESGSVSANASSDRGGDASGTTNDSSAAAGAGGSDAPGSGDAAAGSAGSSSDGPAAGGTTDSAASDSGSGQSTGGSGRSSSESAAQPQSSQAQLPQTISVSVTVDGTPAGGSRHGGTVELSPGANAYDALVAADGNVNARDTVYGTYVAAIDGLAEKQHGGMSGWVYAVNGVEPNTACSNYTLKAGDTVAWTYVNVEY